MGVEKLLNGSPYGLATVRIWLREHDVHAWTAKTMTYTIRGPTFNEPVLYEHREEFVRQDIPELGPGGIPARLSLPEPSMDANFKPYDVDAEAEFTPDLPIRLSGPPAYANSLVPKPPAPESPDYTATPLEFPPTPPMAHPTPLETRNMTPTEKERADGIPTSGFHDDPMINYSLLRRLRNDRLITVVQLYARE
jgi:hypothetical protein